MLESLIYDWNKIGAPAKPARVMLDDETLRDGLQSPSVRTPTIGRKIEAVSSRGNRRMKASIVAIIASATGSRVQSAQEETLPRRNPKMNITIIGPKGPKFR